MTEIPRMPGTGASEVAAGTPEGPRRVLSPNDEQTYTIFSPDGKVVGRIEQDLDGNESIYPIGEKQ